MPRLFPALPLLALLLATGCAQQPVAPVAAEKQSPTPAASAAEALQRRDFRAALRQYHDLLNAQPDSYDAGIGLGEAWLGLGEARPARAAFSAVLAQHPDDAAAREGLGLAHLGLRDFAAAEPLLAQGPPPPTRWRSLNGLGLIADMKGQYDRARDYYEQALAARPAEPSLFNNYGYSRLMAGDYARAEELLTQAVNLSPGNARLRNNLIQAVAWQEDYRRALGLRGDMARHEALNNVGYVAWLRGDLQQARHFFQQALDESPAWYPAAAANLEQLEQTQDRGRRLTSP